MNNQDSSTSQGVTTITPEINSRRELLESSKLSRVPSLPRRTPLKPNVETVVLCVNCQIKLTEENQKTRANVCTNCLSVFAVVVAEIDRAADAKSKAAKLEKFGGAF